MIRERNLIYGLIQILICLVGITSEEGALLIDTHDGGLRLVGVVGIPLLLLLALALLQFSFVVLLFVLHSVFAFASTFIGVVTVAY